MKIIYTDEDLVNIQDISSIPGIIPFCNFNLFFCLLNAVYFYMHKYGTPP